MPSLYPQINLPTLVAPRSNATTPENKIAPKFDWDTGEFVFDSAGRAVPADDKDRFETWCLKVCSTERNTRLAYSDKVGVEFEGLPQMSDPEAVKSTIIRTITEAILVHPQAEWVKNFSFGRAGDELQVSFEVKGKGFEESNLTVTY